MEKYLPRATDAYATFNGKSISGYAKVICKN